LRALFDTSVLIAAVLKGHTHHSRALPWLKKARGGDIELLVCVHSLAEMYAALSRLPARPRISPAQAWELIKHNTSSAQLVELSIHDYTAVINRMSELGLTGGVIYDALIAQAAEKSRADHILTFNEKDYQRVCRRNGPLPVVP
jgi:predicted nucleic acid-binding protein